jgi:nucleotide-binding universal stress UspA family protein
MNAPPRRRIVVGIDGTDTLNHPVLTAALDYAWWTDAELCVVHALAVSLLRADDRTDDRADDRTDDRADDPATAVPRRDITDRAARIRAATVELGHRLAEYRNDDRPISAVSCDVRYGDPATVVLMAARQADLIVLGTRDPRRTDRRSPFLLGSVSQDVALNATCPILLIPPAAPARLDG